MLHKYDLSVENGNLNIRLTYENQYNLINMDDMFFSDEVGISLGKLRFEGTIQIPLGQDMTSRDVPDFSITELTMTSLS